MVKSKKNAMYLATALDSRTLLIKTVVEMSCSLIINQKTKITF